ncbi:RDD family protein [Paraburkholderia sacchari]|uniref:RDD family protein n=1 Tax=Paraburkholderia sacchari TaxID=159450 RepID=UPI003D990C08
MADGRARNTGRPARTRERLAARTADINLWLLLLPAALIALCAVRAVQGSTFNVRAHTLIGWSVAWVIVATPVVLWIDALVFKWFGNTPGKALLGLTVKSE